MKVTCPSCSSNLNIDDKKIPPGGARIKCPTCQNVFPVKPAAASGAVPLPGAAGAPASAPPRAATAPRSAAVPLPGITSAPPSLGGEEDWEQASTRVAPAYVPPEAVPGATTRLAPPSNVASSNQGRTVVGAVPLPGGSATHEEVTSQAQTYRPPSSGAVPLPGISASTPDAMSWEDESTRVVDLPVPTAAYKEPPKHADFSQFNEPDPSTVRMPRAGGAVPLPGAQFASPEPQTVRVPPARGPSLTEQMQTTQIVPPSAAPARTGAGRAVPLPGAQAEPTATVPAYEPPPPRAPTGGRGAVPLPGHAAPTSISPAWESPAPAARGAGRAVPLPGGATPLTPAFDSGFSAEAAVPLPDGRDATQMGEAPGFDEVPEASGFDVAEVPAPSFDAPSFDAPSFDAPSFDAPSFDTQSTTNFEMAEAPPAPAPQPDYSDLPSPHGEYQPDAYDAPAPVTTAPAPMDFGDLPMPATNDLPSPAAPPAGSEFAFDFAEPPPPSKPPAASSPPPRAQPAASAPVDVSSSFGEVDFGAGGESLEFDPTSKPKAASDDFEADLSAPLPPPSKPAAAADGLEMLSFIDETAKEAGAPKHMAAVRRFHVKRRSGKVFGPFEEAVVVKMLEDGQLLGNEEVSLDAESWQPIGAEAGFQGAIAKLMEQPGKAMSTAMPSAEDKRAAPPSLDRLKTLYEGRMAAIAVVQGKEPVPFKKRIPYIVAAVVLFGVLGTGGYLGTTRYGFFGLKVLFPARVKPNSEEFKTLNDARKALLADTFKSYQTAKELTDKLLRSKQYPEVRAVWCQAVFYLQRRYGTAAPAEVAQAQDELENIKLLGEKHAEVVKAQVGAALLNKQADAALSLVASARARAENDGDLELMFLKAEALAAKGQLPQAMTDLKAVLDKQKDSARALHTLGMLHLKQNETDLAAGRFQEALTADANHVASAVELASIELLQRHHAEAAQKVLDQALADDHKGQLSPGEYGRALALNAELKLAQHQPDAAVEQFTTALKADPNNPFAKAGLGRLYLDQHDDLKAVPLLADAVKAMPDNLGYVESYLTALVSAGKMDDALRAIKEASSRFPGDSRLALLQARVDDAVDHTKEAETAYLRAVAADPTLVEPNIALGRLYLRLHRTADAKAQFETAAQKAPDDAQVQMGLGELAISEADYDSAEAHLRKATESNPSLAPPHLGLSRVALARGKLEEAESEISKALAMDPKLPDGRLQRGTVLWKLGKLDEAIRELETAKAENPRATQIAITLGRVMFDKGNLDGATANLLGALQADPGNPEANFSMARVKNKRAEHTQAVEYMKKALDRSPRRADFHYELGLIYQDARKGNEAIDEWKIALSLEPKYADALEAMGRIALERNKHKDAIDFFERAMEADPKRFTMLAVIGDAQSAAEQWDKAIASYLRALEADPQMKDVYFRLGQAYTERHKYAEAITWYRKALTADPENPQSWLSLGWAYKEKKQKAEAVAAFKTYLEKKPDAENKKEIEDEIFFLKGQER